ncbi:MAG: TerD family protein, partial [Leptospiraceae bacterium]|nr:TerD family protein [Leptospiraceae bacterium]
PGAFARSLFSQMLWFQHPRVLGAFEAVSSLIPARLLLSLAMYAETCFRPAGLRSVKPLGSSRKTIPKNPLLQLVCAADRSRMVQDVQDLCLQSMAIRYSRLKTANRTIYIDPILFNMPLPLGERSETIQDLPAALMGTKFSLQGRRIRLFMQWGTGLSARHLDMDLSCFVTYETPGKQDYCSYSRLSISGCQHSGDIRHIPDKVGTAEYIEINLDELERQRARYVCFTCNAFSQGELSPNMVVGWMDSQYPMQISEKNGVAYDPSCVQHQVRIERGLTKGLVFGVLDVAAAHIIWLEMPFQGVMVQNMNSDDVESLLAKLDSRMSIGNLLTVKARACQLEIIPSPEADEVYDRQWALDAAAVSQLFVD